MGTMNSSVGGFDNFGAATRPNPSSGPIRGTIDSSMNSRASFPPQNQPQQQRQDNSGGGSGFGIGGFADFITSAAGVNPGLAQIGVQATTNIVDKNVGTIYKWLAAHRLKYYFLVDNRYVLQKVKILLVPFMHKDWQRQRHPNGAQAEHGMWQVPAYDINAPDLYVPTMALITYTLLMGYVLGTFGKFNPEVLTLTASSSFGMLFFEFCVLKLGFYLTNSASPHFLDLVAYCGYKFVTAIVIALLGFLLGPLALYLLVLVLGASSAVFMMKTLKWAMQSSSEQLASDYQDQDQARRSVNNFLFFAGVIQIVVMYILVRVVINPPVPMVSIPLAAVQAAVPVDALAAGGIN